MRFLWLFYVIDPKLMGSCSKRDRYRYAAYGGIVFLVLLISLASLIYLVYLMTFNLVISIGLGTILAFIFMSLYRLTLLIIQPRTYQNENSRYKNDISIIMSVLYLAILSFLIAKPLELKLFEKKIDPLVQIFKRESIYRFDKEFLSIIDEEVLLLKSTNLELDSALSIFKAQTTGGVDGASLAYVYADMDWILERVAFNEKSIADLIKMRKEYSENYLNKINDSYHLVERFRILMVEIPWSWSTSFITGLILLFPILLKRFVLIYELYFENERNQEIEIILNHYDWFRRIYRETFEKKFNLSVLYFEAFEDPPFNLIRKKGNVWKLNEIDFKIWIEKHI